MPRVTCLILLLPGSSRMTQRHLIASLSLSVPEMLIADAQKAETEDVELPQAVDDVETPERREKVELANDAAEQMQRQATAGVMSESQAVATPDVVAAASAEEATAGRIRLSRTNSAAEIPVAERQMDNSDSAGNAD
jgi:hypothetical protein